MSVASIVGATYDGRALHRSGADVMTAPGSVSPAPDADHSAALENASPEQSLPLVPIRATGSRFWRYGFPVLMVALVLLIPMLVLVGRDLVLHSTEGAVEEQVSDPSAPGWQALTDPTPTLLLLDTDPSGALAGATVLSLASDSAGGVVFIPVSTVPALGQPPLRATAANGADAVRTAVESMIQAGIGEVAEVPAAAWADLVAPVAPLTVENPDDVYVTANGKATLRFPKGQLTLAADDVATYLLANDTTSSDLNALVRRQQFWKAWLAKVGTSGRADAVPGGSDQGLGRFVRALSVDRVETETLPVQKVPGTSGGATQFAPIANQVQSLVARLIPFPIGAPPGSRIRIRVLDGVGTHQHGLDAAPALVQAGGQIDVAGNAPAFGQAATTLAFRDESRRADVERLRAALGVGELELVADAAGVAEVTITLGQDYGGTASPTTTGATGG